MKSLVVRGFRRAVPATRTLFSSSRVNCRRDLKDRVIDASPVAISQWGSRSFHATSKACAVRPYLLADIGEGITECQIMSWFVQPGDRVEQFDRICEVQSDKASVEITSRFDGTITALHYETDEMAIVGKPLIDIDTDEPLDIEVEEVSAESTAESTADPQVEEGEVLLKEDMQERLEAVGSEVSAKPVSPEVELESSLSTPRGKNAHLLTPAVRHLLKSLNIEASQITGTGKDGRILKDDVQRYMEFASASVPATASAAMAPISTTAAPPKVPGQDTFVALTPVENHMFKTMTQSLSIPQFLYTHSINLTPVTELRRQANAAASSSQDGTQKLTPLPFILKAISQAFTQFPKLNAHLDTESNPKKPQLILKGSHNFGIAIDTPQGLLVPVVRDVQSHSIVSLAAEINRLSTLAKSGRLGPDDFKHATFVVSNIGSIGGDAVGPVIVSPMVGIVGVGRVQRVPVYEDDPKDGSKIVAREQVTFSWSADHRVLDGATVARCAETTGKLLENVYLLGTVLK